MKIDYNSEKLYQLISDFYKTSGISITIVGKDMQKITNNVVKCGEFCSMMQKEHYDRCMNSDTKIIEKCSKTRKPAIHVCHAGLLDAALPIIVENEIVGYISMGQIRSNLDFDEIAKSVPPCLIDELKELYENMPVYSIEQMESAVRIVDAIISKIIDENMIEVKDEELSKLAQRYIDENIREELSVKKLCRNLNVSKNRLYECFHLYFNSTVNTYITKKRMDLAKALLRENKLSVEAIAKEVGFPESSYFYKVFKKETGTTPKFYRLKHQ